MICLHILAILFKTGINMYQAHAEKSEATLKNFHTSIHGLSHQDAQDRLKEYGRNKLPQPKPPSLLVVFVRQFCNPLIYILITAAVFSLVIHQWSDAGFIFAVLLINALIGTYQEFSVQKAALALRSLVSKKTRVMREGSVCELDSAEIVPGDIVCLESGDSVPADLRLISSHSLDINESLLTGESLPVAKRAEIVLEVETFLAERTNMGFAGTMIDRGRGQGIVVASGLNTELGKIAKQVLNKKKVKPPLLTRMERFTQRIAILVGISASLLALSAFIQNMPFNEIFMLAVALAVSAIPEGLPIALTVALAISMNRMLKHDVIIKELIAVEALGSCTYIATDKTGTLTLNQLTAEKLMLKNGKLFDISNEKFMREEVFGCDKGTENTYKEVIDLYQIAVLANEGYVDQKNGATRYTGDAVDIALLRMAEKGNLSRQAILKTYPECSTIPFESSRQFSASFNHHNGRIIVSVKGAAEKVVGFCRLDTKETEDILEKIHLLASQGYRILAFASGVIENTEQQPLDESSVKNLSFQGAIAMLDPLRPEAKQAIEACKNAQVHVAMITGDHPTTAFKIAQELNLCQNENQIVTGREIKEAKSTQERDQLVAKASVFARIEPHQKLDIVQSLQNNGHYVAVSGDGVNDAPALRRAHVGVAMGKSGTDVARETADMIITDDNFQSIVEGIREGRIAYANVRKVIFLLISTGFAEIFLFALSLSVGLPLPLLPVQLLWLNLVTNGIQDIALAFEPGEGKELNNPPRKPNEPIFDKIMLERVILSAFIMGMTCFLTFKTLLAQGLSVESARNSTLLLMVLFQNVHVFNSRSETRSALFHNPMRNPFLLFGTLCAQLIHIGAMYTPWIKDVLGITPVSLAHWAQMLGLGFIILMAMEMQKTYRKLKPY